MYLSDLDSTCLDSSLGSPNELKPCVTHIDDSVCPSPLSSSCNRIFPLLVNCSWWQVQNPSSVAWRWRQTLTCNLCSRDTHGIRRRLVLHLQLQFWSAVSPALSCFPHYLTIHQENFLNKTTSTWTWSKTSWQASFATETCPGMELESQLASSVFYIFLQLELGNEVSLSSIIKWM